MAGADEPAIVPLARLIILPPKELEAKEIALPVRVLPIRVPVAEIRPVLVMLPTKVPLAPAIAAATPMIVPALLMDAFVPEIRPLLVIPLFRVIVESRLIPVLPAIVPPVWLVMEPPSELLLINAIPEAVVPAIKPVLAIPPPMVLPSITTPFRAPLIVAPAILMIEPPREELLLKLIPDALVPEIKPLLEIEPAMVLLEALIPVR